MSLTGQTRSVVSEQPRGIKVWRSAKMRRRIGHGLLHLFLLTLGATFLIPFAWTISTSLKLPGEIFVTPIEWIPKNPRWSNFVEVFQKQPFHMFLLNSFFVATMATAGTILSSVMVAFGLARIRWRGRDAVFGLVVATMMLPGVVTLIPLFVMFRRVDWVGTFYPLWVPAWFGGPFFIFLMRQYMMTLPIELDEAAKMDGASNFRILWQIIAPQCGPAIATVAIFASLWNYNSFMLPRIYISKQSMFTVPLGLQSFQGQYVNLWHLVMAASLIAILPPIILFFVAQRYFVQGIQFTGLAGR